MDQSPVQNVDIVKSLENTLTILNHKLKRGVTVQRKRGANHAQPLSPASHAPLIGKSTSAAGARTRLPR